MATRDTGQGASGISRRDFLKASAAATAVVGCSFELAYDPAKAAAYEAEPLNYQITPTTCPYCSASCGQRVVVDLRAWLDAGHTLANPNQGKIVDIYGDFQSPLNSGGLCSKGAGSLQLVNNSRRIGAWVAGAPELALTSGNHPVNNVFLADGTSNPVAYRSYGTATGVNTAWEAVSIDTALTDIASKLVTARGAVNAANGYNSKGVAFFGSSHVNNEGNYVYRKLIADFGTSNVEHQARI